MASLDVEEACVTLLMALTSYCHILTLSSWTTMAGAYSSVKRPPSTFLPWLPPTWSSGILPRHQMSCPLR